MIMVEETFVRFSVVSDPWIVGSDTIFPQNSEPIHLQWRKIHTSDWSIPGEYTSIALSMDERTLYARRADLHVFDVATGDELKVIRTPIVEPRKVDCWFPSILLSTDEQYLFLASCAKLVYQWDIARQTHVQTYDLDSFYPHSDCRRVTLGISLDDRFLCCFDRWYEVIVVNRITNAITRYTKGVTTIQDSLEETSWEMDFYDLVTHIQ
jgi:WD40 repeat protein